ncbi:thiamine pyrophosphate-binding protein [Cohnella massiliensis]|uniref:thiamine pyrophosphate-binding protein n=1 Tax=Cohnella massiliensis TaxID=1816691 RepID=UPI001592FC2C|nr:thiamine pyrophosphate-binding protein [Cohnella massiliensis]
MKAASVVRTTNSDIMAKTLEELGIGTIFGVSGGRILPLFQAINRRNGLRLIAARNEQGAAYMADGYARITRNCGCCISTSGPGASNLLTGIAGAYYDSIPLIVITGQAASDELGKGGIQEGSGVNRSPDIMGIYRNVCKTSYRLKKGDDAESAIREAYRIATGGRPGPVHLDVPTDYFLLECEDSGNAGIKMDVLDEPISDVPVAGDAIRRLIALLQEAKRPLLMAGQGVYAAGPTAIERLRQVQEACGIPVCTSLGGRGIVDETHPLSLGMIGCYGQDVANQYLLERSDLIVGLGISLQYLTTLGWNEEIAKKLIHVDIDRRELGRNLTPRLFIHGSLTDVLQAMPEARSRFAFEDPTGFIREQKSLHGYYPTYRVLESRNDPNYLHPAKAYSLLTEYLDNDDAVILDSGENAYWGMLSLKIRHPNRLFLNYGWGAMGYSLGAAVGIASVLKGSGKAYSVCGDGGFMMNLQEISCAVQYGLPCVWIVLNNKGYGTQMHWQRDIFNEEYVGTDMPDIDFVQLTNAMKIPAAKAVSETEFVEALLRAKRTDGPYLVELLVDPQAKPPQSLGSKLVK